MNILINETKFVWEVWLKKDLLMSAVKNWLVTIYHAEMSFGIEEKSFTYIAFISSKNKYSSINTREKNEGNLIW